MTENDNGANAPSLDDIALLPPGDVAALPAELLWLLTNEAEGRVSAAKELQAKISAGVAMRYADKIAEQRRIDAKDTGTVRVPDGDVVVVADAPKRVDWDQDAIAGIVKRIVASGEDPAEYVETTYKVQERKFNAWPAPIRSAFEAARTVKTGAQKISFAAGA